MHHPLNGREIRTIRTRLGMTEMEFALLFGVTIRTIELWETDVVVPSRITAMVIRAQVERALAAAEADGQGIGERPPAASSRSTRPRRASGSARKLA